MQGIIDILKNIDTRKALLAFLVILIIEKLRKRFKKHRVYASLQKRALEKRRQRDAQIATEFTSPTEIPEETRNVILGSSITELSALLNDDKITSEQILKVYHSRAITIGLSLELIAESNYKEALELAKKCDKIRRETLKEERNKLGGLFGIPISIKDSFEQKGLDSTCGGAAKCFKPCPEDGKIIQLLKSRGAIPFIRSNVPQTLGILDCVNATWGRGLNPWNKDKSIGGSSGGEGGMIAAKCSPIGLGSDAMGSIRIPAAFCGIPSFKPTTGRFSTKGHSSIGPYSRSKMSNIYPNHGPLGRCADDLALFTKELITEDVIRIDPALPYIPWNEAKFQSQEKLRIGYVISEDFFGAAKPCKRATKEVVEVLKKLGHDVFEVKIPNFERLILLVIMMLQSEGGGKGLVQVLEGEKPVKELEAQMALRALPAFLQKIVKYLLKIKGFNRLYNIMDMVEEVHVSEFHHKMDEYFRLRDELLMFWTNNNIDAIITPAMPLPAFNHGFGVELGLASCYLWPANIANLPAGVVPVAFVKEGEDIYGPDDSKHADKLSSACESAIKDSVGTPISIQVMTPPWEDEKCLALMKIIEKEVKFPDLPNL